MKNLESFYKGSPHPISLAVSALFIPKLKLGNSFFFINVKCIYFSNLSCFDDQFQPC